MEDIKLLTQLPKIEKPINENQTIEQEKQEISKFQKSAEIFGKSLLELESEFIDFKVEKLKSKIDYLLEDNFSEIGLKEKILAARKNGFSSITVMPTRLSNASKLAKDKKIGLNALIAYPHGEDFTRVKVLSAKLCAKTEISSVLTPIIPVMLNYYRIKNTEKELVKIKRAVGKKQLKAIVNANDFSQSALTALVKLLVQTKINTVVVKIESDDLINVKTLFNLCAGKIKIEAMGDINLKTGISLLNLGCQKLSARFAEKLCDELITKLKA